MGSVPAGLWLAAIESMDGQLLTRGGAIALAPFVDDRLLTVTAVAPSAWMHALLGELDLSERAPAGLLDLLPPLARQRFATGVATLRRRLRAYLAWHEEADGTWRTAGRGSGGPADLVTSAAASLALLEGRRTRLAPDPATLRRWRRRGRGLARAELQIGCPRLAEAHRRRWLARVGPMFSPPSHSGMNGKTELGAREWALAQWLEACSPDEKVPTLGTDAGDRSECDTVSLALLTGPDDPASACDIDRTLESHLGDDRLGLPWPGDVTCRGLDLATLLAGSVRARIGGPFRTDRRATAISGGAG